ncbi:MAG: bifunctional [glutamate--ammonia ligase]-adenylyl-L-tyrosine phosphorylase/[glutamate--ammonia-ligase] adenylyltransferase [Gammaproteobacteria bacterium]|nr:bifunctional [glutamate--ammonia ligase]-adenylyl-L-tyrosine phosphorylase/[glutamate--ammonia-ligase] adenylyltransferase [Gammaproteobacteria bacterium]
MTDNIKPLPAALQARIDGYLEAFAEAANSAGVHISGHAELLPKIHEAWAYSDFVAQNCVRHPQMLGDLLDGGDLLRAYPPEEYRLKLQIALDDVHDEKRLSAVLRILRRREMVRIACRDLAGWAELEETLREQSWLAEACLDAALQHLHDWQRTEWGNPLAEDGSPQVLVVLGMGKLGGQELNFSSDIDLIFAYPEEGQTNGPRTLSNQEYFTRLGRRLISAISDFTAEGFVFRVDMRLRPYGESGPLAMSFDALEEYYQTHGREWERYAMIKARAVAGDIAAGEQLMQRLRPFVYRRYLDFGTFEALREMKEMIRREIERKGLHGNIKLGSGGIREIEFIGQAFQLIRGGREPELQERQILRVLKLLASRSDLPEYVTRALTEAYVFLRRTENRLQEFADQQTHSLPTDDAGRLRLAAAMGHDDWAAFSRALEKHTRVVHEHFEQVFAAPQTVETRTETGVPDLAAVWRGALDESQARAALQATGFTDTEEVLRLCARLREGHTYRALSAQGRERMDRLMPLLLGAVAMTLQPTATLLRLTGLLEAVARRTAYLALLVENPLALSQLVKLCAASPWLASLLTRHPLLLDELLDPRTLYTPLGRTELEHDLSVRLHAIPPGDLEQQMEALRQIKQAAVLHVAAADVAGAMPLMVVSDHLTEIAEVVLAQVLALAWHHLTERHGQPRYKSDGQIRAPGFAIVGYGKLGGIELSYGSDLDLVFLHDSAGEEQYTTGPKVIDNAVFFARLGQRIIHILNTQTPAGVLYEVDTRLRPSGASGLLVSDMEAYSAYQRSQAWTWEHQALVRARIVAGNSEINERFTTLRHEILSRHRDAATLRREVREMRERMRRELASRNPGCFDLKQHPGGIADIEFMVQYGVLAWACDHPALLRFTDNIRQLQGFLDAGLMPEADVRLLSDAYRAYRAAMHRLTLQDEPAVVADSEFREYRDGVEGIWRRVMEE